MLKDEFYTLESIVPGPEAGAFDARVRLLPQSVIYAAHFRGMPVTPGACLLQMAAEVASACTGAPLDTAAAQDIRFLQPVLPGQTEQLLLRLVFSETEGETMPCTLRFEDGDTLFAKMKLIFSRF